MVKTTSECKNAQTEAKNLLDEVKQKEKQLKSKCKAIDKLILTANKT